MADDRIIIEPDSGSKVNQTYLKEPWSSNQTFMKNERLLDIKTPDTKTSLYLYNINTRKEMNIKLIPPSLAETYSPNIITESPFGILHPINFYTGGSPKTINFSFDIHEDMVTAMGIAKTLYDAMDTLKSMSEPMVKNEVYKEPSVYLQLGDQFAGKGHISSDITYKKPYVNGRYRMAKVSIDFTYHEIFKNDTMKQLFGESSIISSDIAVGEVPSGYTSIDDFYKENLDYDYIITGTIFSDERQESFWSFVVSELVTESRRGEDVPATTLQSLIRAVTDVSVDKSFLTDITGRYPSNAPWFNDILVVYAELFDLLSTTKLKSYMTVYNDLTTLENAIKEIESAYESSYHPSPYDENGEILEHLQGKGWYTVYVSSLNKGINVQADDLMKERIEAELEFLERFLSKLQSAYSFLSNKASD